MSIVLTDGSDHANDGQRCSLVFLPVKFKPNKRHGIRSKHRNSSFLFFNLADSCYVDVWGIVGSKSDRSQDLISSLSKGIQSSFLFWDSLALFKACFLSILNSQSNSINCPACCHLTLPRFQVPLAQISIDFIWMSCFSNHQCRVFPFHCFGQTPLFYFSGSRWTNGTVAAGEWWQGLWGQR